MYTSFEELKKDCLKCNKCPLAATRTNVVFGVGPEDAEVLFIGEGPGETRTLRASRLWAEAESCSTNICMMWIWTEIKIST